MEKEQYKQEYQPSDEMEEEKGDENNRIASSEEMQNSREDYSSNAQTENKSLIFGKTQDDKGFQPLVQSPFFLGDYLNDLQVNYMNQNDIINQKIGLSDFYPFEYCKQENFASFFDNPNDLRDSSGQLQDNQEKAQYYKQEEHEQTSEGESSELKQPKMEIEETSSFNDDNKSKIFQSSQSFLLMVFEAQSTAQSLPSNNQPTQDVDQEIIKQQNMQDDSSHSEKYHKVQFSQRYVVKQNNQQFVSLLKPDSPISYLPMRMYIYLDIVLDLGFLKETIGQESYIRSNLNEQLYSGMRSLVKQVHRLDTKSIEIHTEFCLNHLHLLKYLVEYLMSQQDKQIQEQAQKIETFRINIDSCKAAIKAQNKQVEFKIHQKKRQMSSHSELNRITSQIKSDELVFYVRYSMNYLKGTVETNLSGYSAGLQELLFGSSYAFQKFISEKGYFDPMGKMFKLRDCFEMSLAFTNSEYTQAKMDEGYSVLVDVVTVEGFCFPSTNVQKYYALTGKYDEENGLNFKFGDLLTVNTFTLHDPTVQQLLKEERIEQSLLLNVENLPTDEDNNNQLAIDLSEKDYAKTVFFRKYYCDQIPNLVRIGNKWNKRCGFADIPIRKAES